MTRFKKKKKRNLLKSQLLVMVAQAYNPSYSRWEKAVQDQPYLSQQAVHGDTSPLTSDEGSINRRIKVQSSLGKNTRP
jgi:hypothetical protein